MHFTFAYPFIGILASILLAGISAYFLYKSNPLKLPKPWMVYAVMGIRFISLFIVCFLLLGPMIKWVSQRKEKPILAIAIDNSASMVQANDSNFVKNELSKQIETLKSELKENYTVESYTIGASAEKNKALNFSEKSTNLSDALLQISNEHYNLNHSATLLISDGIYNQGSNPAYALEKGTAPVYTIALGDSTQHKDALIGKARFNPTIFVGNDFEIEIDCKAFYCNNEALQITLSEGNETLQRGIILAKGNNYFGTQKFLLTNAKEGIHNYQIRIKPLFKENNLINNNISIQVNVLKSKQKIVLLYQTPHPDISAITRSIEANVNYELQSFLFSEYQEQSSNEASLFILHQLPGINGEACKLIEKLQQKNIPVFYILGKQTGLNYLNANGTLRITGPRQNYNEAQAWLNQQFNLFQLEEKLSNTLQKFAPLITPFGNYQIPSNANTLLFQQIGYVKTNTPLLFFSNSKGTNEVYLCGEGLWRWRLQDFLMNQNTQASETLLNKIIQWASGKNDRTKFRVYPSKKIVDENEAISFDAERYNDLFEMINKDDISLILKNKNGKNFPYQFSKTQNAYHLNVGTLPAGEYSYEASVNGQSSFGKRTGIIHVKELQTEAIETRSNPSILRAIASETGGQFFQINQLEDLKNLLLKSELSKTVIYNDEELLDLIKQKWLFFTIILFLSLEWFIRKWNGFI